MKKPMSSLLIATALTAVFAVPAFAQGTPAPAQFGAPAKAPATNEAPADSKPAAPVEEAAPATPSAPAVKADAGKDAEIEALKKQIEELKAAKAKPAEEKAKAAAAPEPALLEGLVGTVRRTGTTWTYGDAELGPVQNEPLKAFIVKETTISLPELYANTKGLPVDKPYGFVLEGFFRAEEEGEYGFSVALEASVPKAGASIDKRKHFWDKCQAVVRIGDDKDPTDIGGEGRLGREMYADSALGILDAKTVSLAPGAHKFRAIINCAGAGYNPLFDGTFTMKVRKPGQLEPVNFGKNMLFHKPAPKA